MTLPGNHLAAYREREVGVLAIRTLSLILPPAGWFGQLSCYTLMQMECYKKTMSTIVGCTVSPTAFAFGRALQEGRFTRIELDRIAMTDEGLARYFWVHGTTPAACRDVLAPSDIVEQLTILDELDEAFLCRVHLRDEPTGVVELVYDHDGVFLEASGTPTR